MTRERTMLRLFLASPSDCLEERALAERVISEVNSTVARKLGYGIELVQWEDVVPGMGRPEQVILDHVDIEDTDLFLGVLWNRFGTPTGKAQSGTDEEFQVAYSAWRQYRRPRILLYFCQRASNLRTHAEIEQKSRVVTFRAAVNTLGLTREYDGVAEFEALLRQDLTNYILDIGLVPERPLSLEGSPSSEASIRSGGHAGGGANSPAEIDGMLHVAAGEFLAGRARTPTVIPYSFHVDETPVTNQEYLAFLEQTGFMVRLQDAATTSIVERLREAVRTRADHPATGVTWHEAMAYATWKRKRLPTAVEWERAARGTDGRNFPWGDNFDRTRCNSLEGGRGSTTPVRAFPEGRSPSGCYDMAGNAFEWLLDWASESRHTRSPNTEKINRGGSYNRGAADLMCWYHESDPPWRRMTDVGFRCIWTPEATTWARVAGGRRDDGHSSRI
jgi:formylglycine-generating enzyme required for sulfatase activity